LATLFHAAGASDVIMTMVQGRVLFDGRTVTSQNEAELEPCIRALGKRLRNGRDQPQ
jgi:hypothetical protein